MNESKKGVCFNVYQSSFVLLASQQTWPPACSTLTSLLQHQGSADTVQDNPSGFRPDCPLPERIQQRPGYLIVIKMILTEFPVVWGLFREILASLICWEDDFGRPDLKW